MGFFDFFKKDKGKDLFPENAAAEGRADAIRAEIKRLGLPGDITVAVDGSKVKIGGKVPDEATRRKLVMIAGNVKHVDSVDDSGFDGQQTAQAGQPAQAAAPQAAPAAQLKTYTVESGDTLSKIAKASLGDANAYMKIFNANTPMLKDPDDIYPGQVLIIPTGATASV